MIQHNNTDSVCADVFYSLRAEAYTSIREAAVQLLKDSLVCNGIAQSEKMVRKAIGLLEKAETLEASNASR